MSASSRAFRILATAFDYRPRLGGIATLNFELLSAMAKIPGVELRLLAPSGRGDREVDHSSGIPTVRIPLPPQNHLALAPLAAYVTKEIVTWSPDAIFNSLWLPEGAASLLCSPARWTKRIPYYVSAYGVELLESHHGLKKRVRAALSPGKKAIFGGASGVVSISRYTAGLLEKHCSVRPEQIILAHPGVDLFKFFPAPPPEDLVARYGLKGRKVFLTVTRLDDYKGVDRAIASLRFVIDKHPEVTYLICGTGPDRSRLESLVDHYGVRAHVVFADAVTPDRLRDHYNLADAFVLLSREDLETPNVEGFGLVFLEAAACAKPSIGGRSGGIPDALGEGVSGWLVDPTDDRAIAAAMNRVLEDPKGAVARGASALERARDFSWNRMALTVFEEMRARGGGRRVRN